MPVRLLVYLLITLGFSAPAPAQDEMEVKFDGDEEVVVEGEEEEVVFEDEEEEETAQVAAVAPEHEYSSWLLLLPLLCGGLLVMNVRWRNPSPEKRK